MLRELGRPEDGVAAYDQVLDRFSDDPAPALREKVAIVLCNKGVTLEALGRPEDAVAAYDQALDRFGDNPTSRARILS